MFRLAVFVIVFMFIVSGQAFSQDIMSVDQALEIAVNNYPGIKAFREELTIKDMEKKEALMMMFPRVKVNYGYYRLDEPQVLDIGQDLYLPVLNEASPPRFDSNGNIALDWDTRRPMFAYIPAEGITVGTQDNHSLSFEVTQVLFAGGSLYNNYLIKDNNKKSTDIETQKKIRDLKVKVIEAYYGVIASRQGVDVAKAAIASLQAHLNQAMAFYKAGVIAKNDVLQAKVKLAEQEQILITAENFMNTAEAGLNVSMARSMNEPVIIENDIKISKIEYTLEEAIESSMENRQEIKELDIYMDSASRGVKAAIGGYAPRIAASYTYQRYGADVNIVNDQWKVGLGLEWTLFGKLAEGGTAYTNVGKAKAVKSQVLLEKQRTADEIALQVKDAYLTANAAIAKMDVGSKSIELAEENLRIQTHKYNLQACTSTDVLDAQTMLDKSRIDYIKAKVDYATSLAKLKAAMGIL
jgi:outer membrane protein